MIVAAVPEKHHGDVVASDSIGQVGISVWIFVHRTGNRHRTRGCFTLAELGGIIGRRIDGGGGDILAGEIDRNIDIKIGVTAAVGSHTTGSNPVGFAFTIVIGSTGGIAARIPVANRAAEHFDVESAAGRAIQSALHDGIGTVPDG